MKFKVGDKVILKGTKINELYGEYTIASGENSGYINKFVFTEQDLDLFEPNQIIKQEETTMQPPETKLEKESFEQAKQEVLKAESDKRKVEYKTVLENVIRLSREATVKLTEAKKLRESIGLSEKDLKQLL